MDQNHKPLIIDGKEVKKFLFSRYTRVAQNAAIPVDTKRRKAVLNASDQQRFLVTVQVEAFDKDHAIERLTIELYQFVKKEDWEFIDELDWEHDLGAMGAKHPLFPEGVKKNSH